MIFERQRLRQIDVLLLLFYPLSWELRKKRKYLNPLCSQGRPCTRTHHTIPNYMLSILTQQCIMYIYELSEKSCFKSNGCKLRSLYSTQVFSPIAVSYTLFPYNFFLSLCLALIFFPYTQFETKNSPFKRGADKMVHFLPRYSSTTISSIYNIILFR